MSVGKLNAQVKDTLKTTNTLQEVIVTAERKALDISSTTASKLPLKNIQNPQIFKHG